VSQAPIAQPATYHHIAKFSYWVRLIMEYFHFLQIAVCVVMHDRICDGIAETVQTKERLRIDTADASACCTGAVYRVSIVARSFSMFHC
jgi:hypothetical protein